MNKYIRSLSIACIIIIAATALTKAQDATSNTPQPACKFADIVEVNFSNYSYYNGGIEMGFKNVFSFRHNDNFAIGLGVELDPDNNGLNNYTLNVPVSVDLRKYFNKKSKAVIPFLNLYPGYSFNSDRLYLGNSVFIGLNVGVNFAVTNRVGIELALGLKLEHYGVSSLFEHPRTSNYIFIPFTIGATF